MLLANLPEGAQLIITADHGNDPTWHGGDHTRERVPVLIRADGFQPTGLGLCEMADIGASVAEHLGVTPPPHGRSFLSKIERTA